MRLGFLVAGVCLLHHACLALLEAVEIRKHQLGLDDFEVRHRVDLAPYMGDVVIVEAAQHVDDRIRFADVCEELVAEAFALARAFHEAGDVHEVHPGRHDLFRTGDFGQSIEARLGHGNLADVRLDCAERIVRRLCRGGLG